jgi:holo-[acyl-carrier protein] synthase
MAIYAIGHDIVENDRIKKLLNQHGQQFVLKILSKSEQKLLTTKTDKVRFIAKRFAAKEAFAKACGTGLRAPILMPSISIANDSLGKPSFIFDDSIQAWLDEKQITSCHLSLSDENSLSSAFVVLEKK